MSKRIYPVKVENGELVESSEKLTVNGLPISKDGTIDSSYVSGSGSSEWEVDANGDLVPVDGEPVSVGSLNSDEASISGPLSTGTLETDSGSYQDVTSSRSSSTWETNTTNHPIHVLVRVISDGSAAGVADARPHENTSQTDKIVSIAKVQAADSANAVSVLTTASMIVPPGHEYKVGVPSGSINAWYEAKLGSSED